MTRDKKEIEQFANAIQALWVTFGRNAETAMLEAWYEALKDLPLEAILLACGELIRTSTTLPTPATLRALCVPSASDEAPAAWQEVIGQIRRVGHTGRPRLPDRTLAVIRQMGGWGYLCSLDSDELHKWQSKKFAELYELADDQEKRREIAGTAESWQRLGLPDVGSES